MRLMDRFKNTDITNNLANTGDSGNNQIIMKNVALVGAGYWGKNLARVLGELGRLRTICDTDEAVAGPIAARQGAGWVDDLGAVLEDSEIAAIVIATPAITHFEIASNALSAGKDVYVEKPLALSDRDARRLCEVAREHRRILMVGHLLQYHPAYLKLRELVDAGQLGRLQYIYSHRLNFGKIRTEENILWSFAPHDISMILGLANAMPIRVDATGHCYLHGQNPDISTTHLEFPNGLKAHIFVSWLHPYKEQKLVVVGDRGMAVFDDTCPLEEKLVLYPHSVLWKGGQPEPKKGDAEPVPLEDVEPLRSEIEHFLECIETRAVPRTDGEEGARVLSVLNAAKISVDAKAKVSNDRQRSQASDHPSAMIHESAHVDDDVTIGAGTRIWHFVHVLGNTRIGRDCVLGQGVMAGPNVVIGNNVKIQNNVAIYDGVTLEDDVFCGPSCVFTNVLTPRAEVERKNEFLLTRVGRGATIGANATIVCGNEIGHHAMVGAGAVVTRPVHPHALVVGNPARQIGWMSAAGERLGDNLVCPRTGDRYKLGAKGQLEALASAEGLGD